jgi:hypothetical protein
MIHFQVTRNNDLKHEVTVHEDIDIDELFDIFYSQLLALGYTFGTIQDKIINDSVMVKRDIKYQNED